MQSHFSKWIEAEVEPEDLEDLYKEVQLALLALVLAKEPMQPLRAPAGAAAEAATVLKSSHYASATFCMAVLCTSTI